MQFTNAVLGLGAIALASAATLKVKVGESGLTYSPNNIIAEVGTQVEFEFFPKNHTVTQSSFADPCHPLAAGGFFSDFQPTKAGAQGNTFTITVKDTKPIWFYCSQTVASHCQSGMVGAINAKATGNATLEAFIKLASIASTSTAPQGGVTGGELKVANSGSNSSGTANPTANPTASGGTSIPTYAPPTSPTTLANTPSASGTFPGPSSTPGAIQTPGSASGISSNLFAVAALLFGAMAML